MKVVALISGGKDSCFNMMQCVAAGHDIVALANLYPVEKGRRTLYYYYQNFLDCEHNSKIEIIDELDSYMFQTVGHQGIEFIGEAMNLPLYREPLKGNSKMQEKNYIPTEDDEVEDLYRLIKKVKVG